MANSPSGDRTILQKLHNYHHLFRAQMEAEKPNIEGILQRGRELASSPSGAERKSSGTISRLIGLISHVQTEQSDWQLCVFFSSFPPPLVSVWMR